MANVAILHSRSSLTNNQDDTITPAPTKSPQPVRTQSRYIIPARRTVNKENVKPPVTVNVQKRPAVYNGYVDFNEFSKVFARCRRIKEYAEKNKGGTKEVDLTMKNCLGSNPKRASDQEIKECFAGFMFPDSPNPSALPLPTSLIKKTMDAQRLIMLMIEDMCRDIYASDSDWKFILLRYFNPICAHPSGHIGEDPHGTPNNLTPFIQQVAVGRQPALQVFGTDYSTKDGTGVRDYIHVVDLADGHTAALSKLSDPNIGCEVYNLGTGKGTSVLELVSAFEKASGKKIPLVKTGRRPGDAEIVYAATAKAERELNWKAKYGIEDMCRDQWNWACKNPYGYQTQETN